LYGAERSFWRFEDRTSGDQKNIEMKRSTSLLLLVLALSLGGKSFSFSNQAAAAGTPGGRLGAHPVYRDVSEVQVIGIEEKSHGDEKQLSRAGPINEVEAKRLRLVFLLMMSLGQYRTPAH